MTDELMTAKEVIAYLKISESSFYRLKKEGKLKGVNLGPRTVRYRRADVEEVIQQGRRELSQMEG